MLNRKAQVTMFLIIALLLFFVFFMLYFIKVALYKAELKKQATLNVQNAFLSENVKTYINSCLDQTVYGALEKLGKQGKLFVNETGTLEEVNETYFSSHSYGQDFLDVNDTTIFNETFNTTYLILPFEDSLCPDLNYESLPPTYPRKRTALYLLEDLYKNNCSDTELLNQSGVFGINLFGGVCSPEEGNALFRPCHPYVYAIQNNIEMQIEKYIEKHIMECIDQELISNLMPYNISIEEEKIKANLIFSFAEKGFSIKLDLPVKINVTKGVIANTFVKFDRHYKIRLLELASLAYFTIYYDVLKYNFNKITDFLTYFNKLFLPGFHFKLLAYPQICLEDEDKCRYDTIFLLYDNNSIVRSRPLSFFIAIKNRRPALDLIKNTYYYQDVDIITVPNEPIVFSPIGYDPDDLPITYNYSMWREDYIERFNHSLPGCDLDNLSLETLSKCMEIVPNAGAPHNWTRSNEFIQTHREASYTPNDSEIGFHIVNISVTDPSGLKDWQEVRIVVLDNPIPEVNGTNMYSDINDSYASLEDPYKIYLANDFSCLVGACSVLKYHYNDTTEDIYKNQTNSTFLVPYDFIDDTVSIENIRDYYFTQEGQHNIEYWITYVRNLLDPSSVFTSQKALLSLEVKECLPHRSLSPAYPYNTTQAFYANHTCCLGDPQDPSTWRIAADNNICYESEIYVTNSSYNSFRNDFIKKVGDISYSENIHFYFNRNDENYANDIWKISFERYCDGTRGNVCAGDIDASVVISESCSDSVPNGISYDEWTGERCSGPPVNLLNNYQLGSQGQGTTCVNYDGTTFEKLIGRGTGICSSDKKICNGYFLWNRTCDGQGGCNKPASWARGIDCRSQEEEAIVNKFLQYRYDSSNDLYYYMQCVSIKRAKQCNNNEESCQFDTTIDTKNGSYYYDQNNNKLHFYLPEKIDLNAGGKKESCRLKDIVLPAIIDGIETCFPHSPTDTQLTIKVWNATRWQTMRIEFDESECRVVHSYNS